MPPVAEPPSSAPNPSRLLRFVNLRRGEGAPVLVAALFFFFVLTALMLLLDLCGRWLPRGTVPWQN